jgi:hypothetical protein
LLGQRTAEAAKEKQERLHLKASSGNESDGHLQKNRGKANSVELGLFQRLTDVNDQRAMAE